MTQHLASLPEDLQRVLEMAYNLYHRGLAKDPARLKAIAAALAPHGVATSDFKKFRIGYCPTADEEGPRITAYYAEEFGKYPAIGERFERLGLITGGEWAGEDTLAGCVTFPVLDAKAKATGLIGYDATSGAQVLPHGQTGEHWLFGMERATYGLHDHEVAICARSVLSFFALYSTLGAIGLDIVASRATEDLSPAVLTILADAGAREIHVIGGVLTDEIKALAGERDVRLLHQPTSAGPEEDLPEIALDRLEQVAALTEERGVRTLLRQAVAARRDEFSKK